MTAMSHQNGAPHDFHSVPKRIVSSAIRHSSALVCSHFTARFTSSPNHELPSTTSLAASTNANTSWRIIAEYQTEGGIVAPRDNSKFLHAAQEEKKPESDIKRLFTTTHRANLGDLLAVLNKAAPSTCLNVCMCSYCKSKPALSKLSLNTNLPVYARS